MAVDGQACTHAVQESHLERSMVIPLPASARTPFVQASIQLRQPMHLDFTQCTWSLFEMLSGLWHQTHFNGQPLKNMVLLMPGPSSVDMRWILRMVPLCL